MIRAFGVLPFIAVVAVKTRNDTKGSVSSERTLTHGKVAEVTVSYDLASRGCILTRECR